MLFIINTTIVQSSTHEKNMLELLKKPCSTLICSEKSSWKDFTWTLNWS